VILEIQVLVACLELVESQEYLAQMVLAVLKESQELAEYQELIQLYLVLRGLVA
jgi:hypothetical protein